MKFLSPTALGILGGIFAILVAVGGQVYLLQVQAAVPAVTVTSKTYSTTLLKQEAAPGGVFSKVQQLNQAQSAASSAAEQYLPGDLGKTDITKFE